MKTFLSLCRGLVYVRETIEEIAKRICSDHKIGVEDIRGKQGVVGARRPEIVLIRDQFCYECACEGYADKDVALFLGRSRESVTLGVTRAVARGKISPNDFILSRHRLPEGVEIRLRKASRRVEKLAISGTKVTEMLEKRAARETQEFQILRKRVEERKAAKAKRDAESGRNLAAMARNAAQQKKRRNRERDQKLEQSK